MAVLGGSSRNALTPSHAEAARELGRLLRHRRISVACSGGKHGLIGTMLDAYCEDGGEATAVILSNSPEADELHKSMSAIRHVGSTEERKILFSELSDAILVLPGGVGTMDEVFTFASERKQGRFRQKIVVLDVHGYFLPLREMIDNMLLHGMLSPRFKSNLLIFVANATEALTTLCEMGRGT